jgi:hypothetical protein
MSKETQPLQEGLFGAAKQFSDAFFDGLKANAINSALEKAKKNQMPDPIYQKMKEIDKLSKELKQAIKDYAPKK